MGPGRTGPLRPLLDFSDRLRVKTLVSQFTHETSVTTHVFLEPPRLCPETLNSTRFPLVHVLPSPSTLETQWSTSESWGENRKGI